MNSAVMCQRCDVALLTLSNGGLCAACMLRSVIENSGDEEPPVSGPLILPRTFGSYELLEELGRGGMGVVYRARQLTLDRVVALKLLLGGVYSSELMLRRFHNEAAAAAALRHPGIVAIHDYGEFDGQSYYAMELVEGRNLAQVADGRPIEIQRAARYLREIVDAVAYAHLRNILHRDLKPSNILVDRDDHSRVADFGMAKRLDFDRGVTLTGQLVGSPNYAAPEQVSGRDNDIGVTTDIYSLGALLYHLLTGRPPFVAASLEETLRLLYGTEPVSPRELNPSVPRDLETISLKCLAKEPDRRYPTAAALMEDLDRFLTDRPILARPPALFERARKYTRRNLTFVVATGLVFFSLTVGLAVALANYHRAAVRQRESQLARAQAESLVGFMMRDLQPSLLEHGRLPVVKKTIQQVIDYFEALPPELRDINAMRGHAQALESLMMFSARVDVNPIGQPEPNVARDATRRAIRVRRAILRTDPNDADSATAVIEDECNEANNSEHPDALDWKQINLDEIHRYRELEQRFPENLRVKKGLADALSVRGGWQHDLDAATESVHRWEQLVAAHPDDSDLKIGYTFSLGSTAEVYKEQANVEKALEMGEKTVASATTLLATDPTNLRLLSLAAAMARQHIWWSGPASRTRAIEATEIARGYYRKLMELDPTNVGWREEEFEVVEFEAGILANEKQTKQARKLIDDLIAQAQPLAASPGKRVLMHLLVNSAELAAADGDVSVARTYWQLDRDELKGYPLEFPEHSFDRSIARFTWLRSQAKLVLLTEDWSELARLAQEMIDEMDRSLRAWPEAKVQLLARQADGKASLGKALLRQHKAGEALELLQQAAAELSSKTDWTFLGERSVDLGPLTLEDLPEALRLTGDAVQARSLLEKGLEEAEVDFQREPKSWSARRQVVRAIVSLVEALDETNALIAERRNALLSRAAALFDVADAERMMNASDRKLKAKIESLRGISGL